jgi:hypothetical protein
LNSRLILTKSFKETGMENFKKEISFLSWMNHFNDLRRQYLNLENVISDPMPGTCVEDTLAMIEDKEEIGRKIVRFVVYGEMD